VELEATGSASGRLICSRYAAVLGVGLRTDWSGARSKASEEPDSTTAPALSAAIDLSSQSQKLRCYESFRVKDRAPTFE
jgi:hypothetical protein